MNLKLRITVMNFLQFFIWGSWLISLGGYMMSTLGFAGGQVGQIYATMGIASVFMPALLGIIADRWLNAEKVLGLAHLAGGAFLFWASTISDYDSFYWVMLLVSMTYMPTIALNNSVSFSILERNGFNVVKDFPPIRVWGTVGFILAMWAIDFINFEKSSMQLVVAAGASIIMGLYTMSMPACPVNQSKEKRSFMQASGLEAFVLFKQPKMLVFFLFAMLLGASLQVTNMFAEPFIHSFDKIYPDTFAVEYPSFLISISQISETFFILTIPFFLKRFGIKKVMVFAMLAWVFRFGLFGIGDPAGGLVFLVLSMIVYGLAFDFFNISGSLFVDTETTPSIRSSAQGLFMLMTNGLGAIIGGIGAGKIIDFFTSPSRYFVHTYYENGIAIDDFLISKPIVDWKSSWFTFAAYSLVIMLLFILLFKYKHKPEEIEEIKH